jgi:hypothetical protein
MTSSSITFSSEMHEYLTDADCIPSMSFTSGPYFDIINPDSRKDGLLDDELTLKIKNRPASCIPMLVCF